MWGSSPLSYTRSWIYAFRVEALIKPGAKDDNPLSVRVTAAWCAGGVPTAAERTARRPGMGKGAGRMSIDQICEADAKFWALRELPPFPAIATKLLRLFASEDAEVRQVVSLIRADPAFSSELLRVANSPIYGLRSQVSSLHHAGKSVV